MRKEDAHIDEWARDLAPSTELRRWYSHDPQRFAEFRRRYQAELRDPRRQESFQRLKQIAATRRLTLLTATKDLDHSQAAVLARLLRQAAEPEETGGEAACFAHLVCPECGAVTTEGHRPGCEQDGKVYG